jgi:hypothetical protein
MQDFAFLNPRGHARFQWAESLCPDKRFCVVAFLLGAASLRLVLLSRLQVVLAPLLAAECVVALAAVAIAAAVPTAAAANGIHCLV